MLHWKNTGKTLGKHWNNTLYRSCSARKYGTVPSTFPRIRKNRVVVSSTEGTVGSGDTATRFLRIRGKVLGTVPYFLAEHDL